MRLPGESASKLGHLRVIESDWVRSLFPPLNIQLQSPRMRAIRFGQNSITLCRALTRVFAVDGSLAPSRRMTILGKKYLLSRLPYFGSTKLNWRRLTRDNPHPLLLQDALAQSALYHATVFPLKNIRSRLGSNYEAIRNIVRDSMRVDQNGLITRR